MAKNEVTSILIDEIIRYGSLSLAAGALIFAPNVMIALDKPLRRLYAKLDKHDAELRTAQEAKRLVRYMKSQGYMTGNYEHGLQLTKKARDRLVQREKEQLMVTPQHIWDKRWRIIIYDIPNEKSAARQELHYRLRRYGCFHLQRSVLITPFPCFDDIALLASEMNVETFITYFETDMLANDTPLIARFAAKYPSTTF